MRSAACHCGDVERIPLRRLSRSPAFSDVRLAPVHLRSLRIEESPDGTLKVTPPDRIDHQGQRWSAYVLQPGSRESIEREIARLWSASRADCGMPTLRTLPPNLVPRGVSRTEVAAYIGVGATLFDALVKGGKMPAPKAIAGRKVWDVWALDRAFTALPGDGGGEGSNSWDPAP
jgi:hypothetical protein